MVETNLKMATYNFLQGGGKMGELTRNYNWEQSSIGSPDKWPQSLRTTISILLNSKFPMLLWWGEDLIQFYNDAYRPSLRNNGKHPAALGQRADECWPEIWTIIKPLIDKVIREKEGAWSEDQLIPIYRNGKIEDVYWTFSYSPVIDEIEKVGGIIVVCNETTEKVISHTSVVESKNQLQFAIEATELGTWEYNPVTDKFTGNDRLMEWFGLPPHEEIELQLAINIMVENDRARVSAAIKYALEYKSGGLYDIQYTIIHPITNTERIVRAKGKAWFGEDKIAYRFNGTLEDVTQESLFKKELNYHIALLEAQNEAIPDAILIVDTKGKMLSSNSKFEKLWKIPENIIQEKDDAAALQFAMTQLIDPQGFIDRVNYCYAHPDEAAHEEVLFKDGRIIERYGNAVTGKDGTKYGWAWYFRDITEQRKLEEALKESESHFRKMVEQSPIAIALTRGRNMIFETINVPMLQLIGKSEDVINRSMIDVLPEIEGQTVLRILYQVYDLGEPYRGSEIAFNIKTGDTTQLRYFNLSYTPIFENGEVAAILHVAMDVTELIVNRNKIIDAEERTRLAMESAELGSYEVDLVTDEMKTSERFNAICGVEHNITRKEFAAMVHPDDKEIRLKAHAESVTTGKLFYEARIIWKDNTTHWVKLDGKVLHDANGKAIFLLGVMQDITEQKNLQQQKDNFIAMASHELKTPVTSIKAYGQVLEQMLIKKGDIKEAAMIARMDNQVNRLTNLISDLLNITKINTGKLEYKRSIFNFNQLVNEMTEELERTTDRHKLIMHLDRTTNVFADKERIGQVITNFISNGIKYSPDADIINVSTIIDGKKVIFCVEDFGIGISKDSQGQVFEQFYRVNNDTHQTFQGLGLGLYISSEIIKREGGKIWLTSEEGKGSKFYFSLEIEE